MDFINGNHDLVTWLRRSHVSNSRRAHWLGHKRDRFQRHLMGSAPLQQPALRLQEVSDGLLVDKLHLAHGSRRQPAPDNLPGSYNRNSDIVSYIIKRAGCRRPGCERSRWSTSRRRATMCRRRAGKRIRQTITNFYID